MMKKLGFPIVLAVVFTAILIYGLFFYRSSVFIIEEKSEFVDPLIGTDFHGHTYPGATMPFGMVQLSPDTRLDGWDGCSAFHFSDSVIYGFSHTHLSGTGCSDYGDILLMPTTRYNHDIDSVKYTSVYRHDDVVAKAGFYSVLLKDYDILAELTVTPRVGFHRYTYPDEASKFVVLDLEHRDEVLDAYVKQVSDTRLVGLRRSKAWANDQILYFVADFSMPFKIIDNSGEEEKPSKDEKEGFVTKYHGKNCKIVLDFSDSRSNQLLIKLALSATSENGAIKNLDAEVSAWNFDEVKLAAKQSWDEELSKILVYGGRDQDPIIFYTALYHSFVAPNIYSDVDGSFRGTDLNVYQTSEHDTYTVFSLWDTYRATHPLFTLTQQKRTLDFIKTFLDHYRYGGMLPVWELSANETGCMIGYHSVPVIVDAYFKGIKEFDTKLALEAMIASAKADELGKPEFAKYGFIPLDKEHESVSKTLEYAYDDWCIAMFAKEMGSKEVYQEFIERSQYYKNIFNPENGFMQAKINAAWQTPFDPKEVNYNFTEANSWQYSFYVPQDILSFIDLHGGNEKFAAKLDEMFAEESKTSGTHQVDITGLIGQYAHGNEPSHHMAYLYNYCGQPWKTQMMVRKIMMELYTEKPDGLCGNEDCGQMSSWYVFSALGFYPVNPANGIYDLGSPIFDKAVIQLENKRNFTVIAHNNSAENIYVQSVKLNGKNYNKTFIYHKDIIKGGTIEFTMGAKPNKDWGVEKNSAYVSKISEYVITAVPYFDYPFRSFHDSIYINIKTPEKNTEIFYCLDDEKMKNPIKYTEPVLVNKSSVLFAYAQAPGKKRSKSVSAEYMHIPDKRTVKIISTYSPQYSAGGDQALVDFVKGEEWFRSGLWQGYRGQNFEAIVDLTEIKDISLINASFLQDTRSWIFFPKRVIIYTSTDGVNFNRQFENESTMSDRNDAVKIQNFTHKTENLKARYVKVWAESYGKLPQWHLSPGYDSWIFIDEIEIK